MSSRSGKRLTNKQRKANQKKRARAKKNHRRQKKIAYPRVPTEYSEIYGAVKQYIIEYVNSYYLYPSRETLVHGARTRSILVIKPVENQDRILDINSITLEDDRCILRVDFHREFHMSSRIFWKCCFYDPNFFPSLRVFLDKAILQHWGCDPWFSNHFAESGGILDNCVPDVLEILDAETELIKTERTEGPFDLAPVYELYRKGQSVGRLVTLDGFVRFGSVKRSPDWIASGHLVAFAHLVAEEIRKQDDTDCSNDRLYRSY
jgi:hypothetical protein